MPEADSRLDDVRQMPQQACLADPARRERYIAAMFDTIAPRYDQFTRWFSFGMDRRWKQELIAGLRACLGDREPTRGLDLACGTGDLALAVADACPEITVTGVDLSEVMIAHARPHARVAYRCGTATALPEGDGTVEVLTIGYGLRNVPDHRQVLREAHRVLAPGGVLAVLDFTRPRFLPWRWCFLAYLWVAGMSYGWWWHRHGPVYGYIAGSIQRFTSAPGLREDVTRAGFEVVACRTHLGGAIAVLTARRRP